MNIQTVPIDSLSEDPSNARRFGQQKPIVVDATNTVRAGNGTLMAAKSLGWKIISIVRSDLAKTELTAFAIADNRSAELAEWDAEILSATLSDPEIGDVGFLDEEIRKLTNQPLPSLDSVEMPAEKWLIVVTCKDEVDQAELLERFATDGLKCKALLG
jgi:ParB-like chromosome segregation protein Spo0J